MSDSYQDKIAKSITSYIEGSKKIITILFTDIEDSTAFWEEKGDVQGRLIMDQHNRMLFPVIDRFNGKVIKTIGDAVMASFKVPSDAVKAAIAIQQYLRLERKKKQQFNLKVRIGIHTGEAIVEQNDIYGDVVNVASRVEEVGKAGQILLTQDTADYLGRREFVLVGQTTFTPRGKQAPMSVSRCKWDNYPNLLHGIDSHSFRMIAGRQKKELLLYALAFVVFICFFWIQCFRFLAVELRYFFNSGDWAGYLLSLPTTVRVTPVGMALIVALIAWIIILVKLKTLAATGLSALKGGFGLCAGFFICFLPTTLAPGLFPAYLEQSFFASSHGFVRVVGDEVTVRKTCSSRSESVDIIPKGKMVYMTDEVMIGDRIWNRVLLDNGREGWVIRVTPPKMGVTEKIVTKPVKFAFFKRDVVALLVGWIGFIWGFFTFRIKPA
jgi:class 3 adenylate cyclase